MRWRQGRRSSNIEDRRGAGGGMRMPGGRGVKVGGIGGIVLLLLSLFLGVDLTGLVGLTGGGLPQVSESSPRGELRSDDEAAQFISAVLADTEDTWSKLFDQAGETYQPPVLVLFSDGVESACGFASSAAGPFYCPGDSKVYIDLSFFRELERMGAGGDFAQAYVLAHEVGHHVQNQLGVSMAVQRQQRQVGTTAANRLSVLAELQADCYAGVWAHHAQRDRQVLEPGDLEEGMNAAGRIGDDQLMKSAGRQVRPEAFTHGTSEQRQTWLYRGLETGDAQQCDTFGA